MTGADFTPEEAEILNIITKYVPKIEIDAYVDQIATVVGNMDISNITMYKNIVTTFLRSEEAGAAVELHYFLERAKQDKTQTIITAFLNNGRQTEREANDMQGIFVDTTAELFGKA